MVVCYKHMYFVGRTVQRINLREITPRMLTVEEKSNPWTNLI